MNQTVNVNFKLDLDVKKKMESACTAMGLTLSTAFTLFARKVGNERRIPFEISADPFYSESNINYLNKVIDGIEDGTRPLVEHNLIEVDEE